MKKVLFLIFAVLLVLSCSDDKGNNNGSSSQRLLTQIVINYPNNKTYTKQYSYEQGNKLSEVVDSNGNREYYTYQGDFISKIEYFFASQNYTNDRLFVYDNAGRLIEETYLYRLNSVGQRTVFTYLANGNVAFQRYSGNLTSQTMPSYHGIHTLNSNKEIVLTEEISDTNSAIYKTETFTYDDKNSPFLNVRDASKEFKFIVLGINNVQKYNFVVSGTTAYNSTSEFLYNIGNFPISEHKTDGAGLTLIDFTYN